MDEMPPTTLPGWTLADRLVKSRAQASLTQPDMADRLGSSLRTIRRYESGDHAPSKATVVYWAQVTGVALDWLLGTVPGPTEPAQLDRRRTSRLTRGRTDGYRFRPLLACSLAA